MMQRSLVACAVAMSILPVRLATAGTDWQEFHPLPGFGLPGEQSSISRLSDDGTVAVGSLTTADGVQHPAVWINGQAQLLPTNGSITSISDLSGDGRVLVGTSYIGSTFYGSVWERVGDSYQQHLVADLPGGGTFSKIYRVSRDGTRGIGIAQSFWAQGQAAYWNIADGPEAPAHGLGYLQPWNITWSEGYAISADGGVMAGTGRNDAGDLAFSTRSGDVAPEPGIHGIDGASAIFNMSFDARYMVGYSRTPINGSPSEPTIWVDGVAELLPLIPGLNYTYGSRATFVTDNGSIISGTVWIGDTVERVLWIDRQPIMWDDYLDSLTIAPEGWRLLSAMFSEDGRYLYGNAINPEGLQQGFVAVIPAPAAVTTMLAAIAVSATRRRRFSAVT